MNTHKESIKIIQINSVYATASTGRTCKELSDGLKARGHEVYTAYGIGHSDEENTYRIGNNFGLKIHSLCSRIFGLQGYFSFNSTRKLVKYIDEIKPDIVHLRNLHANYINLNILVSYLAKKQIATVLSLHDCWFMTGKCTYYTIDGCYKWKDKDGCKNCPRLKKDNKSWLFDRTSKMWKDKKRLLGSLSKKAVVGVSKWVTDEARQSFLGDADIIEPIYNWVDLNNFRPRENSADIRKKYNIGNGTMIVSVATFWDERKGLNNMVKLAGYLKNDERIVLVGSMPEGVKLPENIIAIGRTDSVNELAQIYSAADVCVSLSMEETFGKTIAEAIASGIPAIVYDSTAVPELVSGDKCGYVVPCGDIEAIYEKIQLVGTNTKEYYKDSCVAFARDNFDKEKQIEKTLDMYKRLLSK